MQDIKNKNIILEGFIELYDTDNYKILLTEKLDIEFLLDNYESKEEIAENIKQQIIKLLENYEKNNS